MRRQELIASAHQFRMFRDQPQSSTGNHQVWEGINAGNQCITKAGQDLVRFNVRGGRRAQQRRGCLYHWPHPAPYQLRLVGEMAVQGLAPDPRRAGEVIHGGLLVPVLGKHFEGECCHRVRIDAHRATRRAGEGV